MWLWRLIASKSLLLKGNRALIEKTIELFQQIDVIILNAGISAHFLFEQLEDLSVIRKLMEVNFYGCVNMTK